MAAPTFRYPVRLSRLRWMFLISPYSANLSWMSSSVASSWTPVTKRIQPSTAASGGEKKNYRGWGAHPNEKKNKKIHLRSPRGIRTWRTGMGAGFWATLGA